MKHRKKAFLFRLAQTRGNDIPWELLKNSWLRIHLVYPRFAVWFWEALMIWKPLRRSWNIRGPAWSCRNTQYGNLGLNIQTDFQGKQIINKRVSLGALFLPWLSPPKAATGFKLRFRSQQVPSEHTFLSSIWPIVLPGLSIPKLVAANLPLSISLSFFMSFVPLSNPPFSNYRLSWSWCSFQDLSLRPSSAIHGLGKSFTIPETESPHLGSELINQPQLTGLLWGVKW